MSVNRMSSNEDFNKVETKVLEISTRTKSLFLPFIFPLCTIQMIMLYKTTHDSLEIVDIFYTSEDLYGYRQ